MERNIEFAAGRVKGSEGILDPEWRELAIRLNEMGVKKTSRKWARCWIDWKCTVKRKHTKIQYLNGEGVPLNLKLTALEQRLVNLLKKIDETPPPAKNVITVSEMDPLFQEGVLPGEVTNIKIELIDETLHGLSDHEEHNGVESSIEEKEKREEKATGKKVRPEQLNILLRAMEENPSYAMGQARAVLGVTKYTNWWETLAVRLNECGVQKTPEKWQKCWIWWKAHTKIKNQRWRPGRPQLSPLEKRLFSLMRNSGNGINLYPHNKNDETAAEYNDNDIKMECRSEEEAEEGEIIDLPTRHQSESLDRRMSKSQCSSNEVINLRGCQLKPRIIIKKPRYTTNIKKAYTEQLMILLRAMEENPSYATGNPKVTMGDIKYTNWWRALTIRLNSGFGTKKTPRKWQRCWIDWKIHSKKKYLRLRPGARELNSLEMRVLNVMGETNFTKDQIGETDMEYLRRKGQGESIDKEMEESQCVASDPLETEGTKADTEQLIILLQAMEESPSYATGNPRNTMGLAKFTDWWRTLTDKLNSGYRTKKTPKKWQRCWIDLKTHARKKHLGLRPGRDLNSLEMRVLNVMGEGNFTKEQIGKTDTEYLHTKDQTESIDKEMEESQCVASDPLETEGKLITVSSKQLRILLEDIERNPHMDDACQDGESQTLWRDLAKKLNACGEKNTHDKWMQCWMMWKSSTKDKERKLNTGEHSGGTLSLLEKRLLKFLQERDLRESSQDSDNNQCNSSDSEGSDQSPDSDSDLPITRLINPYIGRIVTSSRENNVHNNSSIRNEAKTQEDLRIANVSEPNQSEDLIDGSREKIEDSVYLKINSIVKREVRRRLDEERGKMYFVMRQKYREARSRSHVLKF